MGFPAATLRSSGQDSGPPHSGFMPKALAVRPAARVHGCPTAWGLLKKLFVGSFDLI
jgi:hypothetical protein